jgi:hypothetical protein
MFLWRPTMHRHPNEDGVCSSEGLLSTFTCLYLFGSLQTSCDLEGIAAEKTEVHREDKTPQRYRKSVWQSWEKTQQPQLLVIPGIVKGRDWDGMVPICHALGCWNSSHICSTEWLDFAELRNGGFREEIGRRKNLSIPEQSLCVQPYSVLVLVTRECH